MLIFVGLTRYKLPARTSLIANYMQSTTLKDVSKIDISRIYRNDLFNTYKESQAQEEKPEEKKLVLPTPPAPQAPAPVQPRPVQFLEPLPITLKGIMYSTDERSNRVVIEENKSKSEKLYKVGDTIEDSEIVRIYYNKVMIIRSNGQQETLFVSPQEAQKDSNYKHEVVWQTIIQQKSPTEFMVDKHQFIHEVKNLAEFIDMLDVTTAFKKGKTIGCRIGVLKPQSIGIALGLLPNDIIVSIADIPTTTTNDRVEIFTKIKNMTHQETVAVKLLRNGNEITQIYSLLPEQNTHAEQLPAKEEVPQELQQMHEMSNKLVMESHTTKNPMIERTQKNNLSAMTNAPSSSSLLQQVPT
jgi:type II secretion system protein C